MRYALFTKVTTAALIPTITPEDAVTEKITSIEEVG